VIMVDVAGVHPSIAPYQRRRGIVQVVAGVPASTTPHRKRRGMRYRYRLIISMLLVSIPLMAALAVVLTTTSSASLTSAADQRGADVARAVTVRLEDWMSERHEDLAVVADQLGGNLGIAGHVRLTTQQQRSATSQVVETMEELTDASRQVSATAQQIAAAAGSLADLAGNLEATAAATRERY
jgi:hypothetical protein